MQIPGNVGGVQFATGPGTVLMPVAGNLPMLWGNRSGVTRVPFRNILNKNVLQVTDPSFVEYDASPHVPPGATAIYLNVSIYSAFIGSKIRFKAKGTGGPYTGFAGGPNGDGSTEVTLQQTTYLIDTEVAVPLDAQRRFLYQRTAFGDTYFGLNISGWEDARGFSLSAPQTVFAGSINNYAAWPDSWLYNDGTRLICCIGWNGSTPNDHGSGGAVWLMRNEGSPTMLFTAAQTGGSPLNEAWPIHNPSNKSQAIIIMNRLVEGAYYSISNDSGSNWSAPAALPAFTVNPGEPAPSGHQIPYFFMPSWDGTKVYGTFYGTATGHGGQSVWLGESTNGVNWNLKKWITLGSVWSGNETVIGYTPNGYMHAAIRHSNNLTAGGTCRSVNDGASFTPVVSQTSPIQGHRPLIPLGNDQFVVPSRYVPSGLAVHGLCSVLYRASDGAEIHRSTQHNLAQSAESAYPTLILEPDGVYYLYYYSDCTALIADDSQRPSIVKSAFYLRP